MTSPRHLIALLLAFAWAAPLAAQREFGFDNTRASGQPYLSPAESVRRMRVPPGYEVKVFAAEPDIVNPIAFTVDERGRLWVVECYEYPKRTAPGRMPRDRIKILEDTTGAGRADKVTVWAEGKDFPVRFDMASGIEVGHGGVVLGAAPYLFFLRDTKGAGCCTDHQILLDGFGSQDTHEVLNTFQWGPDGLLYGLHGIFTQSRVAGVPLNAAVWRYDPRARRFGVFAEGTSNPWGLDFDAHGQAFLTACVIPHCFHMIPGGTYIRQAGASQNPYAYGLLGPISDHLHHQESGWAHAGALVMQGDQVPAEYRGSLLMGSIHGCAIKRDVLERRGSTFVARHGPDFLVSGDKNFRPINLRWGPDGSIYVIDWHDQNPCHQAHPDSWDMTHGRIYKIQRTGAKGTPPGNVAGRSSTTMVALLKNNNAWWHRTALRLLGERRDLSVAPALAELLAADDDAVSLRGLWGLYAVGAFNDQVASNALRHHSPWVRSWAVRLLGEPDHVSQPMLAALTDLARTEPDAAVRLQLAATAQRLTAQDTLPLLHGLMRRGADAADPAIPLMLWLAYEPRVGARPATVLGWLRDHAAGNALVRDAIVPRAVRRLLATGRDEDRAACVAFLGGVSDVGVQRRALEGFQEGLPPGPVAPPAEWARVLKRLLDGGDPDVRRLALHVAVRFRDAAALRLALAAARDVTRRPADRVEAIRDVALAHPPEGLRPLLDLVLGDSDQHVQAEACRALAAYDSPEMPSLVLAGWRHYPTEVRTEAVNLLAQRKPWAAALLQAVAENRLQRADLTENVARRLRAFHDPKLDARLEAVWGKLRDTPAELNALIARMRVQLGQGRPSFERGRQVFEAVCAKCHQFEGRGHEVGPALDGAGREIEYLLVNVLDPNRVVGKPYYTRFVSLKDGRVESGLLAAEDGQSITLKTENAALKVIPKKDIEEMTEQAKSLMPEGLDKNLTVQNFRDVVRYVMADPFVTEVAVAGPWPASSAPAIDPRAGAPAERHWTRPVVGVPGRIPLPAGKGGTEQVAYVAAELTAPVDMDARLLLGAGCRVAVWLNGVACYDGVPARGPTAPDQVSAPVRLKAGANRMLIRATYPAGTAQGLYVRFHDPLRKLRYPEPRD